MPAGLLEELEGRPEHGAIAVAGARAGKEATASSDRAVRRFMAPPFAEIMEADTGQAGAEHRADVACNLCMMKTDRCIMKTALLSLRTETGGTIPILTLLHTTDTR